jgi:hypothetical protein
MGMGDAYVRREVRRGMNGKKDKRQIGGLATRWMNGI